MTAKSLPNDSRSEIADMRELLETLTQTQGMYLAHTQEIHARTERLVTIVEDRLQGLLEAE